VLVGEPVDIGIEIIFDPILELGVTLDRLCRDAQASEPTYPPSQRVEE
jgi:hypothetical protein